MATRVLVGSPVKQKASILKPFLESLHRLDAGDMTLDFLFVDDNAEKDSSKLLRDFARAGSKVTVIMGGPKEDSPYQCNEEGHFWRQNLIHKVIHFKNTIITYALSYEYDYVFFIDSDLLVHPKLIQQLHAAEKDIVSEIFWTRWQVTEQPMPNVWLYDNYDMIPRFMGEEYDLAEKNRRFVAFLDMLRQPGVYEVGGLGACTLISRAALSTGVNFNMIKNLSFFGEDRHFCVRAAVHGLGLYVDTHYPAYHIYRESYLDGVKEFMETNQ